MGKVSSLAEKGDWFIISGGLPPGIHDNYYAQLIQGVQANGAKAVLNPSGRAIVEGLKSKPYLIKPNRDKLFELTAIILDPNENYRSAILSAYKMGASTICLSLGSEGAIFSVGNNLIKGIPPDIEERNPVAAGDALLARIVAGISQGTD